MQVIQDLVRAVRSVRALTMIGEKKPLRGRDRRAARARPARARPTTRPTVRALAFLESFEVAERVERPPASRRRRGRRASRPSCTLGDEVDLDKLKGVLEKRLAKLGESLAAAEREARQRPASWSAPTPEIVAAERERLAELRLELELLRRNLAGL